MATFGKPVWRADLSQGSEEWLAWRKQGIGASDYPAITGTSPYKTLAQLVGEKTDVLQAKRGYAPVMKRGHEVESDIRGKLREAGYDFNPTCIETDMAPHRASLDGVAIIDGQPVVLECKYVGAMVYSALILDDSVPQHFIDQITFAMAVCGASHGFLVISNGDDFTMRTIPAPSDDWMLTAYRNSMDTWNRIQDIIDGRLSFYDDALEELAQEYLVKLEEYTAAKIAHEQMKALLLESCEGQQQVITKVLRATRGKKGWRITPNK